MKHLLILINPFKLFCILCAFHLNCAKRGKNYLRALRFKGIEENTLGDVRIIGSNVKIGEHSYINSGHISTSEDAGVFIGKWCAIGHNVTLLANTHDSAIATGPVKDRPSRKGNVIIEDGVWIGSNVIVTPGVKIGALSVIGGNSVVTKDIPPYSVAAGLPCKVLYKKDDYSIITHSQLIGHQITKQ